MASLLPECLFLATLISWELQSSLTPGFDRSRWLGTHRGVKLQGCNPGKNFTLNRKHVANPTTAWRNEKGLSVSILERLESQPIAYVWQKMPLYFYSVLYVKNIGVRHRDIWILGTLHAEYWSRGWSPDRIDISNLSFLIMPPISLYRKTTTFKRSLWIF